MDVYNTEEQQVEAIKSWWHKNGIAVSVGVVIGLAALLGWRYYEGHQHTQRIEASDSYNQVLQGLVKPTTETISQAQSFIDNNSDSQYSVLMALQLAKVEVDKGNLDAAITQLQWVTKHTSDDTLLPVAQTRWVRILSEQGKYDQALAELKNIQAQGWQEQVDELRGDVLVAKGDITGARAAYLAAQKLGGSPTLQLKLDNLAQEK